MYYRQPLGSIALGTCGVRERRCNPLRRVNHHQRGSRPNHPRKQSLLYSCNVKTDLSNNRPHNKFASHAHAQNPRLAAKYNLIDYVVLAPVPMGPTAHFVREAYGKIRQRPVETYTRERKEGAGGGDIVENSGRRQDKKKQTNRQANAANSYP